MMLRLLSLGVLQLLVATACGDDDTASDDERATEVAQAVQATLEAAPSATPTASPTGSPTATTPPTATPSSTATASPTATTSPTVTPSATATATPTQISDLNDFEGICSGGRVIAAPAYDRSVPGPHPMVSFRDEYPDSAWLPLNFPEGWIAPTEDPSLVQLVACLERNQVELVRICEGYGTPDRQDLTVELYDATYNVTLYAAQSGEELDSTTFLAESGDCPMLAVFKPDQTVVQFYADPSDNLKDFVAPYVMP